MSFIHILTNNFFVLKFIAKKQPILLCGQIFAAVGSSLTAFITSTLMLRFVLNRIQEKDNFFTVVIVISVCLLVHSIVAFLVAQYHDKIFPICYQKLLNTLRKIMYKKAQGVDLDCYENPEYYNTLNKAISESSNQLGRTLNTIGGAINVLIGFSANYALILEIDPVLSLFILLPVICTFITIFQNKLSHKKDMELEEETHQKGYVQRVFFHSEYAKEMRLTNMYTLMFERFKNSSTHIVKTLRKYGFSLAVIDYLKSECLELICPLGATLYAVWKMLEYGTIGYGDCVVVVTAISISAESLVEVVNTALTFQKNALYIEEMRKFLEHRVDLVDGNIPVPENGDIVLEHVSFKYRNAHEYALKDICLKIGQNEKVAIVGHNGAGKTTLVKLLLRLYDADGKITYGGIDIRNFNKMKYRNLFSVVLQETKLFALTIKDNVLRRPSQGTDIELVTSAIEQSGFKEKCSSFPSGVETVISKEFDNNGVVLSGGEQQKLAIAHVFSKKNNFVILDEPSSALDPVAEHELFIRMNNSCKDCGVILISHRLSSVVNADKIYVMEKGSIIESGTHDSLLKQNGVYATMFSRQAVNYKERS